MAHLYKHSNLPGLWNKADIRRSATISGPRGIIFYPHYAEHKHLGEIKPTQHGKYKEQDFEPVAEI